MTEIIDGKLVHNETTKRAFGGTELVAERLIKYINPEILKDVQIISSRVREVHEGKTIIYHCHDTASDPESDILGNLDFRKRISKIVFVSHWQADQYCARFGIGWDDYVVIPNPIEPFKYRHRIPEHTINIIYHTTPHRGLEILIPVFEHLAKTDKDVHLDVYSSFEMYGWEERDAPYKDLFKRCLNHPQISYHGFKPNPIVREALSRAHIFAYPSIWPETSCLALIEAVAAGCSVIHPNYAALPETAKGMTDMYQQSAHGNIIANRLLDRLLVHIKTWRAADYKQITVHSAQAMNQFHDVRIIAMRWENLIQECKQVETTAAEPQAVAEADH